MEQNYNQTTETQKRDTISLLDGLSPKSFQFFVDNEKLPYFTFKYKVVKSGEPNSLVEVSVDALVCTQLIYAGVQYGIDLMSSKKSA